MISLLLLSEWWWPHTINSEVFLPNNIINVTEEHRCKNPQQNKSKPNPTIYLTAHIPWSSGIYPRTARSFQYYQIQWLSNKWISLPGRNIWQKIGIQVQWKWVLVDQSCLTLCNHMDCSPPGPSVHGIFQARILE